MEHRLLMEVGGDVIDLNYDPAMGPAEIAKRRYGDRIEEELEGIALMEDGGTRVAKQFEKVEETKGVQYWSHDSASD